MKRFTNESALLDAALACLAFAPLLIGAANEIQEIDPLQYAEVSRRMLLSGDWAHLKDFAGPFLNKPPATFWLMAIAFRIFGPTSFAVRLPSLLMGAVLLGATARLGTLMNSRRVGWLAAALLGASPAFQLMVADPKVDMVATAFMTLAVLFLYEARTRPRRVYVAWVFAALGVLTKGPIGLVAPAMAVVPEALRQRWDGAAEPSSAGFGRRLWCRIALFKPVTGLLLFVAVLAPWYVELTREYGREGPLFMVWTQGLGRLLGDSWVNDTTPAFFLHTGLWAFLPFTPAFVYELARRLLDWRKARFQLPPDAARLLLWWFLLPFIVISLSRYKLPQYLFWLAPPAALMSARRLALLAEAASPAALTWLRRIQAGIAGLVPLFALGFLLFCFPAGPAALALWVAGVTALVAAGFAASGRLPGAQGVAALAVLSFTGFNAFFQGYVHPSLLEYQPVREFGELARKVDPDGHWLPLFRTPSPTDNGYAFYARRETTDVEQASYLAELVARGETRVAITSPEALGELEGAGLTVKPLLLLPSFPTSRPSGRFLRANTRPQVVSHLVMVKLSLKQGAANVAPTSQMQPP